MKKWLWIICIIVLILIIVISLRKNKLEIKDAKFEIEHDGLMRDYYVHVPSNYNNEKMPVVMYIHGGGGNVRSAYLDGMDKMSDKHGFLLVIPEGVGEKKLGELRASWNGGEWEGGKCCGNADDVGFISKVIDDAKKNFNVDEKRIYATGISNGGLMTNRIGCELADKVAAIATVAPAGIESNCNPFRKIPVMDIHGTDDTCNPFDGSEPSNPICKTDYKRTSHEEVINFWMKENNCSEKSNIIYNNGGALCISYTCSAEVVFCKVDGMGHAWPSGFESKTLGIYPVSQDISFDQMWEFFEKHSLK